MNKKKINSVIVPILIIVFFAACQDGNGLQLSPTEALNSSEASLEFNQTQNAQWAGTQDAKYTQKANTFQAFNNPTETPFSTPTAFPSLSIPSLDYDLIWLRGGEDSNVNGWGKIFRWDPQTGRVNVLIGQDDNSNIQVDGRVLEYHLSDNNLILVLIEKSQDGMYEIGVIDLFENSYKAIDAKESTIAGKRNPYASASISPDGRWVAYKVLVDENYDENNLVQLVYNVTLQNLENEESKSVGNCIELYPRLCENDFTWSQNDRIAWHSIDGIWVTDINGNSRRILDNVLDPESPYGFDWLYFPISWSPNEQQLVVFKAYFEGGFYEVFEIKTDRYERLPDTARGPGEGYSETIWLNDDRILVMYTSTETMDISNSNFYLYKITRNDYPLLSEQFHFELENHPWEMANGLLQKNDGSIQFYTVEEWSSEGSLDNIFVRMYSFEINRLEFTETLRSLEKDDKNFHGKFQNLWLPDNSGILIYQDSFNPTLLLLNDEMVYDLSKFTGPYATDFHWIEK